MSEGKAPRAPGGGLTDDERRMLFSLSSGAPVRGDEMSPAPATPRAPMVSSRPGSAEGLNSEEEKVRARAREESERLTRDKLARMLAPGRVAPAADLPDEMELADVSPRAADAGARRRGFAQVIADALDVVNYPFRRVSQAWRLGLGFCGVLLLIALLMVMLVRTLASA